MAPITSSEEFSPLALLMNIAATPYEDHGTSPLKNGRNALLTTHYMPETAHSQPRDTASDNAYQPDSFINWLHSLLPQDREGWYSPEKFELFVSLYQDVPEELGCAPDDLKTAYGYTPHELTSVYTSMHSLKTDIIHHMITDLHKEALEIEAVNRGKPRQNETLLSQAIANNAPFPSP